METIAPLLDTIRAVAEDLEPRLVVDVRLPGTDRELLDGWESELLEEQRSDLRLFLALFDKEFFSTGIVGFSRENCEPVLRACAALRLRMRATLLTGIPDEGLESGEVPLDTLSETELRSFASYMFLSSLQEILIRNLDPNDPESDDDQEPEGDILEEDN